MMIESSTPPVEFIEKAFYTEDNRLNPYELNNLDFDQNFIETIHKQTLSIACMVANYHLIKNPDNTYRLHAFTLTERIQQNRGYQLTDEEKFRNEPAPGFGTAFLVGKRDVLTAAHCVCVDNSNRLDDARIKATRFIFNFQMTGLNNWNNTFDQQSVYQIKKVKAHRFFRETNSSGRKCVDWAWIKLDRKVEGRDPLKIDFSPVGLNEELYMLGHPNGIPMKLATTATVRKVDSADYFEADLAAFNGNSGSPIFKKTTNKIVGVLFEGHKDYDIIPNYKGTSESRLKTHQVTKAEINAPWGGYEKCQQMSNMAVFNHSKIAWHGRKIRKELSNKNSEEFNKEFYKLISKYTNEQKSILNRTAETVLFYTGITAISDLIANSNKESIKEPELKQNSCQEPQRKSINKLNEREELIVRRMASSYPSIKARNKIVRNMCAYDISEEDAIALHTFETEIFQRKYSPDKILDLLVYERLNCHRHQFTLSLQKSILKSMQKMDPRNTTAFLSREEKRKAVTNAIAEATIRLCIRSVKKSPEYTNYPVEYIKQIARHMSQQTEKLTFDAARIELRLPVP